MNNLILICMLTQKISCFIKRVVSFRRLKPNDGREDKPKNVQVLEFKMFTKILFTVKMLKRIQIHNSNKKKYWLHLSIKL